MALSEEKVAYLLQSWKGLNTALDTLTWEELCQLLEVAVKTHRRIQVIYRIYGKFNKLRARYERERALVGELPWE